MSKGFGLRVFLLAGAAILGPLLPAAAQEPHPAGAGSGQSAVEIPEDLRPEGENRPALPQKPLEAVRYDDEGFPEDPTGLLVLDQDGEEYLVYLRNVSAPFLLYAQFVNRQRDAVFLARDGALQDPLPDGSFTDIPYGYGALKTNTLYISLVEGLILPHLSDNRKTYQSFPLQDLYLGASLGVTGLLAEVRYVHKEQALGFLRGGVNLLGGLGGTGLAPLNYYAVTVHAGGGIQFPGLLENLIGSNHWSVGGELMLGLGDADRDPNTPAVLWMPGVSFELQKRNLFGWGGRWAGFGEQGDHHEDPRPLNYHVRALYARLGLYVDLQNGRDSGYLKLDAAVGFRYNLLGPRIPEHRFKETRVLYLSDEYREQVLRQREQRQQREQRRQGL